MTAISADYPKTITAGSPRSLFGVGELWQYRDLVRLLAARDVKLRFRQTRLGPIWLVVNPLFFTLAYAFLFGTIGSVDSGGRNFFVFTYVGMSLWTTGFQGVFLRTSNCLLGNRELLTHVYFPRLSVPLASTAATAVDVVISWGILTILLLATSAGARVELLLVPVWFLISWLIALSCGLIVASWSIALRDLQSIAPMLLAAGPIFTPIAYTAAELPGRFSFLATLNPLTPLFEGMRASAFGMPMPGVPALAYSVAVAGVLLLTAGIAFRRAERRLADVI